jgi:hypothetical protein
MGGKQRASSATDMLLNGMKKDSAEITGGASVLVPFCEGCFRRLRRTRCLVSLNGKELLSPL